MELGGHVLDAFNIDFNDFLDNVTYATVIDLVGKYQLEMQQVFSYAPMARSMGPMLQEEAFHLGSGRKLLKEIGQMAARGEGDYSILDVQRAMNLWYPRGLEMFGNEQGEQLAAVGGLEVAGRDAEGGGFERHRVEEAATGGVSAIRRFWIFVEIVFWPPMRRRDISNGIDSIQNIRPIALQIAGFGKHASHADDGNRSLRGAIVHVLIHLVQA